MAKASVEAVKAIPYIPFSDLKIDMEQKDPVISAQIEKIKRLDTEKMSQRNDWIKYDVVITADNDVSGADFTISLDGAGVIEFDLISMIPEDAVDGIFRRDLFEALAADKTRIYQISGWMYRRGNKPRKQIPLEENCRRIKRQKIYTKSLGI